MANSIPGMAHKMKVFATAEGGLISGYAYLTDGTRVKDASVRILAIDNRLLQETVTDSAGSFRFTAKCPMDHRIVVDAGDGHLAEFRVTAAELAGMDFTTTSLKAAATNETSLRSEDITLSAARLQVVVDKAVARQLRPLREEFDAYQTEIRWRDVLGGIGYIVGMAGIAFYFLGCRQGPPSS